MFIVTVLPQLRYFASKITLPLSKGVNLGITGLILRISANNAKKVTVAAFVEDI